MQRLSMRMRTAIAFALYGFLATLPSMAHADANADAKVVTTAFSKAFEACDVPAILNMYEDDATLIWPGDGEFATGKAEIEKVVKANCGAGGPKHVLTEISSFARAIGKDYIMHWGQLDDAMTVNGKTATLRFRVSELLHKSGGKWRYVVDHASAGLKPPPPPASDGGQNH